MSNFIDIDADDDYDDDGENKFVIRPLITIRKPIKTNIIRPIIKRPRKPRKVSSPKPSPKPKNRPDFSNLPEEPEGTTGIRSKIYRCYNRIPTPYKPFLQFQYDENVINNTILIQDKLKTAKRQLVESQRQKQILIEKTPEKAPQVNHHWYNNSFPKVSELQPGLSVKTQPIPLNQIPKLKKEYRKEF